MIVNYIKAVSDPYLLKIPNDLINSELEITIRKVKDLDNNISAEELIKETASILNLSELDIIEYQRKMRGN